MTESIVRRWILSACLLLTVLTGPLLSDGSQTGTINGVVRDDTGVGLPGVDVTVIGPQIRRRAISDSEGRFRVPALGAGSYSVEATLLGLSSVEQAQVFVNRNTEVELELGETTEAPAIETANVSEWIEVVAEAPLLDRYDLAVGGALSYEFLDELPVERFYQSVALALPGVAGGEDGNPNVGGALRSSNLYLIDGVDTTDSTTGLFGLNLAFESIQMVDATTAAAPPEFGRVSGAVINVVTRSGSNRFNGAARLIGVDPGANGDYRVSDDAPRRHKLEVAAANTDPDQAALTLAGSLSGPLVVDHLWFFGAYEDASSNLYRPTRRSVLWDEDASLDSSALKLSFQPTSGHTIVGQHTADSGRFNTFAPMQRGPAENRVSSGSSRFSAGLVEGLPGDVFALEDRRQSGEFNKLQWNAAIGQNLSFEFTAAQQERRLDRQPLNRSGFTNDAPHASVITFSGVDDPDFFPEIEAIEITNGITDQGFEERPREQANLVFGGFAVWGPTDHEIRAGIDYQHTESVRSFNVPGESGIDPITGLPAQGQLFLNFDLSDGCLFGGVCDPYTVGGERFKPFVMFNFWQRGPQSTEELSNALYLSDTIATSKLVLRIGARYEDVEGKNQDGLILVEDQVIAPRIGLTYDPIGNGNVILSANWGRFYEPFLQQYLDGFGRYDVLSGFTEYFWGGVDNPGSPCSFADPTDLHSDCWWFSDLVLPIGVQEAAANTDLRRSHVDELVVGFERKLTSHSALRLHYIDRQWKDLWDDVLFENGDDYGSQIDNLDIAERDYRAVQFLVQKQYANNWQGLFSYTWSEARGNLFANDGLSEFADFVDITDANVVNRYGFAPYDRPHRFRAYVTNRLPFERVNLSFGNIVRFESGVPLQQETFDIFGTRFVTPRGSDRLGDVFQWDLSFGFDARLASDVRFETKAEVFNVTDQQELLGAETYVSLGQYRTPRSIVDLQRPRTFRLTFGLRF